MGELRGISKGFGSGEEKYISVIYYEGYIFGFGCA